MNDHTPQIRLDIRAVELKRGWVGQVVRTGEIVWESGFFHETADQALDSAYRAADQAVRNLAAQPEGMPQP